MNGKKKIPGYFPTLVVWKWVEITGYHFQKWREIALCWVVVLEAFQPWSRGPYSFIVAQKKTSVGCMLSDAISVCTKLHVNVTWVVFCVLCFQYGVQASVAAAEDMWI